MIVRPLIQFRQTVETALNGMTNLSKPFVTFFIETMEMYLSVNKKINFTQMARFGRSCERRFRQNSRKAFDWINFNRSFMSFGPELSYISSLFTGPGIVTTRLSVSVIG